MTPKTCGLPKFTKDLQSNQAMPGQIWNTLPASPDPDEALTHWVLVLGRELFSGSVIYRVAPMFSETEMGDHQDAILPPELLGFEAGFAFGLTFSTASHTLNQCVLELPEEWTARFLEFERFVKGRSKTCPDGVETSIPYIDHLDSRIDFHSELLAELDYLQESLGAIVGSEESGADVVVHVDFWSGILEAQEVYADRLAAATDLTPKVFVFTCIAPVFQVQLRLDATESDPDIRLIVADLNGEPSAVLNGFTVVTATEAEFVIQDGAVSIPVAQFGGTFTLVSPGKEPVELRVKTE